ncbi:shTK domain protein, partial [Ostertagia ostertagi]
KCTDRHDLCKFWMSIGECQTNKVWMEAHCPVSCDVCNGTMACVDRHRLCNFWTAIRECETNAVWMLSNCPKSCNACKGKTIGPGGGSRKDGGFREEDCTFITTHEDRDDRGRLSEHRSDGTCAAQLVVRRSLEHDPRPAMHRVCCSRRPHRFLITRNALL